MTPEQTLRAAVANIGEYSRAWRRRGLCADMQPPERRDKPTDLPLCCSLALGHEGDHDGTGYAQWPNE